MEKTKEELKKKVKFLKVQIAERIQGFTERRNNNKHKARNFQVSITVLGAISTIILGLNFDNLVYLTFFKNQTKNIALIISALITIISAYNTFFDHKGLWVNYTTSRNSLYNLDFEIDYYLEGNEDIEKEKIEEFKERYNEILVEANHKWSELRG
jgi:F0F1-type ATP synthase assembly protein I